LAALKAKTLDLAAFRQRAGKKRPYNLADRDRPFSQPGKALP
jgi:hypothetical protein